MIEMPIPVFASSNVVLYTGDCLTVLQSFEDNSVQCCVTSPPFYGLRSYGGPPIVFGGDSDCTHIWGDKGPPHHPGQVPQTKWQTSSAVAEGQLANSGSYCTQCSAWYGDLGQEQTPVEYIEHMTAVFREVRRVLKPTGSCWIEIGDSYAAQRGGTAMAAETIAGGVSGYGDEASHRGRGDDYVASRNAKAIGLRHKDMIGIPWRLAFALQASGWILRSDIIWHRPAPMPESVKDRPTKSHSYVFLLVKNDRYLYNADAIAEKLVSRPHAPANRGKPSVEEIRGIHAGKGMSGQYAEPDRVWAAGGTRNARSVWTINTEASHYGHYAVMPQALARRCILAGSNEGDVVLDPFCGTGTTVLNAAQLGRKGCGVELNDTYNQVAIKRLHEQSMPMLFGDDDGE